MRFYVRTFRSKFTKIQNVITKCRKYTEFDKKRVAFFTLYSLYIVSVLKCEFRLLFIAFNAWKSNATGYEDYRIFIVLCIEVKTADERTKVPLTYIENNMY